MLAVPDSAGHRRCERAQRLSAADGGGADGGEGADGGAPAAYSILALLSGEGRTPARVVAIDPATFTGKSAQPGALPPCKISGATTFSAELPASWTPGPEWPDGIPYADAGAGDSEPPVGPALLCSNTPSEAGTADAGSPDGGLDAPASPEDAGETEAGGEDAAPEDDRGRGSGHPGRRGRPHGR